MYEDEQNDRFKSLDFQREKGIEKIKEFKKHGCPQNRRVYQIIMMTYQI